MDNFMTAHWSNLIMANYSVDPALLKPYLPEKLELDLYNGLPYVSLVGFLFDKIKIFGTPVPGFGRFEEINLRFYVVRKDKNETRRGVVFIKEAVPNRLVAWLANNLYREHYISVPTRHIWNQTGTPQSIEYQWKVNRRWNRMAVRTGAEPKILQPGSMEEFIFEHYYGYTKARQNLTEEYHILHPKWFTNDVSAYEIDCDFTGNYGKDFGFLQFQTPQSVLFSEGSAISIKWKRNKI
jgi:uncharacterized protein